ncbi:SNF2 helicase associated domain-containing protein [Brevibacillus fortis]|uniref:DEAD/DEAH box helicase n=1 Tax=Brevibacillus fortis TaxID=2126352 RepID=UPI002E1AFA6E|nr:SNF2 helicase associated domain-containing protein [Brevibacillus fortis]
MSFQVSHQTIKEWCGHLSYERGKTFYRSGNVLVEHFQQEPAWIKTTVNAGKNNYQVTIELDESGMAAVCSCPTLASYDHYCQHIAASLLTMRDLQVDDQPGSYSPSLTTRQAGLTRQTDSQLTEGLFGLFVDRPIRTSHNRVLLDLRTTLALEIICEIVPYGFRKSMIGIELRLGPKRLYIVKDIRAFLDRLDKQQVYRFSSQFTYDPNLHRFLPEHEAVLRELLQIYRTEKIYRETASYHYQEQKHMGGERILLVPPITWERLFALLLTASSVHIQHHDQMYPTFVCIDEPPPLHFEFDQIKTDQYQLEVQGFKHITVLEAYGLLLVDGKWHRLPKEQCHSLAELKHLLESHSSERIHIPAEKIEPFMVQVVPALMKLGKVQIAKAVSDRVVQFQLKAKLYLDRVRDRLLAGLEFQYGDIVINPLEGYEGGGQRGSELILMRDGEKEQQILDLMEESAFTRTEGGYFLDDEEAEYDFLYHVVPKLEKLVKVYATTSVKIRIQPLHLPPKVKVDVDERTNWLDFRFDMDGIPESEIRSVIQSVEEKRRYHRLSNGALLPLETKEFEQINRFLDEMGMQYADQMGNGFQLPAFRGLRLLDIPMQGQSVQLGKSLRQFLENMRNPDNLDFPVPESLQGTLRDYQKFGYQWMKTLAYYGFGGILADDMGLGKTLQSITFLLSVLPEIREQKLPAIIVAPASLLYNWQNEIKKFAPNIRSVIVDGTKEERNQIVNELSQIDVLITSYPLLRRDHAQFEEHSFHTLILDEAQTFKNYVTQTAQIVKRIKAKHRFALTGTPVENRVEELWSIYDVVFPELFPARKEFLDLPRDTIAKRTRPFLLRRLKTEVLKELPAKIETLQSARLLPEQKKLYVAYLAQLQQETVKHLYNKGFQKNRIKILAGLTRLRQICCHPALFVKEYDGGSAKLEQLFEIIGECKNAGKRVLLFSQFTEMLGMIGRELGYHGVPFFYLDGQTPVAERLDLCNRFNEGERDLFLMSLKAGGTGLNVTGADTVILYDLWWNPAVEQQAADRAHRIGQKKVVQVIRLVAEGTVEEKMYELQQKKKNLIEEIITPGQEAISSLTEQEIRELLMI